MDIALYGGSFDPPHIAHLEVIKQALENLKPDKLFVLVAYQNPFKTRPCFSPQQRLVWMGQLLKDLDKVQVSDFEILQNRPVPSIESVEHFYQKYQPNKLYFIIGADNVAGLERWEGYWRLQELVELVVVHREGYALQLPQGFRAQSLFLPRIQRPISSTQIRICLKQHRISHDIPYALQPCALQTFKENYAKPKNY
ncbi:Nicotinate (nicotinamide) nucleotide adenylyltransferase NadD [Helicobacter bizzozeronii]|uniref:nicotinate (nicotinamide) nucleotide adenylyltransferase n=1 Tax=Helicobacter bizzozeronii TaxID=56877 RepID=UPI00244D8B3E|nr:nicotinate (nicotinamide) nucleotide adenylyltransferase [Helicobacter bizzozeronii]GMB93672.1 Nicotinate (nicotinamide) nucleotide adenylyltransferase NadD [Helicobacter bizzozeronii]